MGEIILEDLPGNSDIGVIHEWHVDEGDEVQEGEIIVEVRSDRKLVPITASAKGILHEKYFEEGDEVELGEPIGAFEEIEYSALEEYDI